MAKQIMMADLTDMDSFMILDGDILKFLDIQYVEGSGIYLWVEVGDKEDCNDTVIIANVEIAKDFCEVVEKWKYVGSCVNEMGEIRNFYVSPKRAEDDENYQEDIKKLREYYGYKINEAFLN